MVPIPQQKIGSVTRINLSAAPAFPGEPDSENAHVPQTPPQVEGNQIPTTPPLPPQGDAAPGTPPLPRRKRQIGIAFGHDHLMTHFLKCNGCDICKQAKVFMAPVRRSYPDLCDFKAEKFADLLWSDHIIVGKQSCSRGTKGEKVGLFIYDVATHVQDILVLKGKNSQNTITAPTVMASTPGRGSTRTTQGRTLKPQIKWGRCPQCPPLDHRPQSNGLCGNAPQRGVRRTKGCLSVRW